MPLNDVIINKVSGGLGKKLSTKDHISGIIFFNANTLPVAWTTNIKKFGSLFEVEASGILKGSASFSYEWYQLSEYFRLQPAGEIYVMISTTNSGTYSELTTLQNTANGDIKQVAIFDNATTFATAKVDALQTVATSLESAHRPLQIIATFKFSTVHI